MLLLFFVFSSREHHSLSIIATVGYFATAGSCMPLTLPPRRWFRAIIPLTYVSVDSCCNPLLCTSRSLSSIVTTDFPHPSLSVVTVGRFCHWDYCDGWDHITVGMMRPLGPGRARFKHDAAFDPLCSALRRELYLTPYDEVTLRTSINRITVLMYEKVPHLGQMICMICMIYSHYSS